jgi:nucleotide-binding universal stress UspA family protein
VDPPVDQPDSASGTDGPAVILIAIDESVTALRAAAYAVGLARRQGARLVALYVEPLASLAMGSAQGAPIVAAERELRGEIGRELAKQTAVKAREFAIPLSFVTAAGDPYREITRVAGETRADAIVVGASLRPGHRVLGSLAVRLVRAGKWPVTVVP